MVGGVREETTTECATISPTKLVNVPCLDVDVDMECFCNLVRSQSEERHHHDRYPSSHRRDGEGDERFPISGLGVDGKEGVVIECPRVDSLQLELAHGGNTEVITATLFDECALVWRNILVVWMMIRPKIVLWIVGVEMLIMASLDGWQIVCCRSIRDQAARLAVDENATAVA